MPADNVTPFRRPPRRPQQKQSGGGMGFTTHRGKAVLVQALTLATYGLSWVFSTPPLSYVSLGVAITAVAIAASNRYDAMPWARTHHEHALRTLIIGYVVLTLVRLFGMTMSWLHIALPDPASLGLLILMLVVYLWVAIRAGVGLVLAILRKPIWHPTGILL